MRLARTLLVASSVLSMSLVACQKDKYPAFKSFADARTKAVEQSMATNNALVRLRDRAHDRGDAALEAEIVRHLDGCKRQFAALVNLVPHGVESDLETITAGHQTVDAMKPGLAAADLEVAALEKRLAD